MTAGGDGGHVLVVDDRPDDRKLLRLLLEHGGHRVVEAANGTDALRCAAEERPAVVVSDILLPGMGGYELARRFGNDPELREIPVILCSAHFGPWEVDGLAETLGVAAVVPKPVEPEDLLTTVDTCLAARPARPAADSRTAAPELVELLSGKLFEKVQQLEILSGDRQVLLGALVRTQEDERRAVAAALHDDAVQVLYGAVFMLESLGRTAEPGLAAGLAEVVTGLRSAGDRLSRLMNDLQPPTTGGQSLMQALGRALDRGAMAGGFHGRLDGSVSAEPSPEQFTVIYRIAQEALANVVRHSGASRAIVAVHGDEDGILTRVEDDGRGFAVDRFRPGERRVGLTAMRERADLAGGWWRIVSRTAPPAGTTVEFWIPLRHG